MSMKMSQRRRNAVLGAAGIAAIGILASACGSTPSASPPTGTTLPNAAAVVKTSSDGTFGTILVSSKGFVLYHRTSDPAGKSACTGSCAAIWHPVTVSSSSNLAVSGLSGFSTTTRSDGTLQLTYKGESLYTYAGDSSAGQTTGQGVDGIWFVVEKSGSPSGGGTTTTTTGGYGY